MSTSMAHASGPDVSRDPGIADVLGGTGGSRRRWPLVLALTCVGLVVAGGGAYLLLRGGSGTAGPAYRTVQADRGDLVVTVTATGNLQPTNQVQVGSEQSGSIERVLVDVNDKVHKGELLAQLDLSKLRDQLTNARGQLAAAHAQLAQAQANEHQQSLNVDRLRRMQQISHGVVSQSDLDAAEATWKMAQATVASGRAAVTQAQAALGTASTNLDKGSIRSPVDGVVLTREIEPGQTVAASLQAPVLFTIAEDLSKMQLQVDVDEADVGTVRNGQRASFTVDAWPQRTYEARVQRVSFGSQTVEGVVSYPTLLSADNRDLSLRPGMTATAVIVTAQRRGVLLVPNAALRFAPPSSTDNGPASGGGLMGRLFVHRRPTAAPRTARISGTQRQVWVLQDGRPKSIPVSVGETDGRMTEITGGSLHAGMPVIVDTAGPSQ